MEIEQQLKELPSQPGIYMFYDQSGTVLYVGKAIDLRTRVRSYFRDQHLDRPWIGTMISSIHQIETTVVTNELEALMLEATLIKQYLPKYNIKLTDDKAYPFIRLSKGEKISRFSVVRRRTSTATEQYFGPYLSARAARHTLEFLRDLYGIHISDKPLTFSGRTCFHCQLTGHACPMADEISPEAYQEKVRAAVNFLRGKRTQLLRDLEQEMDRAAEQLHFERAAKLRDRLNSAKQVVTAQSVVTPSLDDYDALGAYTLADQAAISVLRVREGRVTGAQHFFLTNAAQEPTAKLLRDFLVGYYPTLESIPHLLVSEGGIEDRETIAKLFTEIAGRNVEIRQTSRGEKHQLSQLAQRNAETKLRYRLITTTRSIEGVLALQELLKLPQPPERIEAIDISNLGKSEPVGASVCFIQGQPDKNEYRRYVIKTVSGQNDFAMIGEVAKRRLLDGSRPLPDLLVIDGGPEQLAFALEAHTAAGSPDIKIVSLAKKPDRIFLPGKKRPVPAPKNHKGLLLLGRIRDEVHRFGITFQRTRQRKSSLHSDSA